MGTCRVICLLAVISAATAYLTSPPRMLRQPPVEELLFQVAQPGEVDKPFIIECEAEGEPAPKYRWLKNGKPFEYTSSDNRISQQPGRGTLVVSRPQNDDLGQYQCFATNEWGTATSNSVFVRKAELNSFNDTDGAQKIVSAQEGQPFKLTCVPPDGHPKPKVYWILQGDQGQLKTINNPRITLDPEGNLLFSNVTWSDKSTDYAYTCAAKSLFRNEYKFGNKVFLMVERSGSNPTQNKHEPIRQYVTRKTETALKGKKTELYCIYGGTPLPNVVWSKDGSPVRASQEVTQDNYGKTLVIKHTSYEDAGTYSCDVSNGVGSAQSYSIKLNVESEPFITEEPTFQYKSEGETAVISCKADGTPTPQIAWILNGKPIDQAEPNPRRTVTANSIIISDLTKQDTGNYGCNVTNPHGYVYKEVCVNVQKIPPEMSEGPTDQRQVLGSEAVFKCRVFGAPEPIVTWIKDGVLIAADGKYNMTEDGDLVVSKVSFADVGSYECYAKNKYGETRAAASLTVQRRTVITESPANVEAAVGSSAVTFRCNAMTDDSLNIHITWLHNGQPIDFENQPRFVMGNDNSLVISRTVESDSGVYACIARTEIDEARAEATLTVQDRP